MNVERGTFTTLVFSLTSGEGTEISMFHKHIAQKIANKTEEKNEKVQTLINKNIFPNFEVSFIVYQSRKFFHKERISCLG